MVQRLIQKIKHHLKRLSGKASPVKPAAVPAAGKSTTRPKPHAERRHVPERKHVSTSQRPVERQKSWSPSDYVIPPAEGKTRFSDLGMPDVILHAVADLEFKYCTPVQAMAIPPALEGRDIAGKAQTGTGKTAAFLVAVFTHFLRNPRKAPGKHGAPRALILAPTRELVIQIESDAQDIGKYCGLKVFGVYGGMDYDKQQKQLLTSSPDVLVATPGRLLDFRRGGVVDLSRVDVLVIDEADRMLDMGFIPDVRTIVYSTPPKDKRQTLLFSATLTDDILRLASRWMKEPVMIEIEAETVTVDAIKQVVYTVPSDKKFALFFNLLKRDNPERVLMFCNRRDETERVMYQMARYGINAALLSGAVPQKKRLQVLEGFRAGTIRVLVATDVAGRGLHVDGISHVINYDIPLDAEDYVHRIGRTGRAGADGIAYTFACENAAFTMPEIEKYIGRSLDYENPEPALLVLPSPTHAAPRMERPPERRPACNAGRGAPRGRYGASRARR
jgi:ATP-dependent RNA helicase RhlB